MPIPVAYNGINHFDALVPHAIQVSSDSPLGDLVSVASVTKPLRKRAMGFSCFRQLRVGSLNYISLGKHFAELVTWPVDVIVVLLHKDG